MAAWGSVFPTPINMSLLEDEKMPQLSLSFQMPKGKGGRLGWHPIFENVESRAVQQHNHVLGRPYSNNFNEANIEYRGDATASAGNVELNKIQIGDQVYLFRIGQVIHTEHIKLQDFHTKQLTNFTTHFSFIIDTSGPNNQNYGDGLVFFIAPVGFQSPANSAGGGLGLLDNSDLSDHLSQNKDPIVFVEFDSYADPLDPPYEHVGININSLNSSVYTRWNSSFHSGDTANVWISYNAVTKNLTVSWTYQSTSNSQEISTLSYHVDLMKVLPMEWVIVGIGGSTGFQYEHHILKSWYFSSDLDYSKDMSKIKIVVVLCVSIFTSALIFVSVMAYYYMVWRRNLQNKQNDSEGISLIWIIHDFEKGAGPRRFSYRDLVSATNNFSDDRKLGQGGFGAVYKGHLSDLDIDVAVKKISRGSKQGVKEYISEVTVITRLKHRNLVQLIGWCHDRGQFLLVYEFMPNGSLDSHLFGQNCTLTWDTRQNKPLEAVDQRLQMEFDEEQAKCMIVVGLWCAHPDHTLRPSIKQAIQVMNFEVEKPDLNLQMLAPMYEVPSAEAPENSAEPLISNSVLQIGR
ncbi:hypothetical protein COLO4_17802 [Corchorus olitorius]|uniref:Protein kinase domain-containing protein n=1 Tax=Corchorus olitorius TaxID=93759 RepID=A0A1R3JBI9_9ROSI|nr:hypothetical protein COLO4_17802 [Corchorus olitorius]